MRSADATHRDPRSRSDPVGDDHPRPRRADRAYPADSHRESTRHSNRLGELEARIELAVLRKALSEDARERAPCVPVPRSSSPGIAGDARAIEHAGGDWVRELLWSNAYSVQEFDA
jgi:hypothetical protein